MSVDERHADPDLTTDPRVVVFRKRVDVRALLEACQRAVEVAEARGAEVMKARSP